MLRICLAQSRRSVSINPLLRQGGKKAQWVLLYQTEEDHHCDPLITDAIICASRLYFPSITIKLSQITTQ